VARCSSSPDGWLGTAPRIPGRATTLMGCPTEPGLNVPDSLQGRSPRGLFGRNAAENLNGPPPLVMPLIDRYGLKCHTFVNCRSFVRISEMNREGLDVISIKAVPCER
jgi:hypothetical protein